MLSKLAKAERNPNQGWNTLSQHCEHDDESVEEDDVLLLDPDDEPKKRLSMKLRSPLEYKCQLDAYKIPKRTSPRSFSTSKNACISPTTKCGSSKSATLMGCDSDNDNLKGLGYNSGFSSSKLRSNHTSLSPRTTTCRTTANVRYMMERQRSLPVNSRTYSRQKSQSTQPRNTESLRTRHHDEPFDSEINMFIDKHDNNKHEKNSAVLDDDSDITENTEDLENAYHSTLTTTSESDDKESNREELQQARRHMFPSSNINPRPPIHADSGEESESNKNSFYGARMKTYQITKNKLSGCKKLTRLQSDDKKRKLPSSDGDRNDGCREPTKKKMSLQKNRTKKGGKKSVQQSSEVSLVEIISSDEEDKEDTPSSKKSSATVSESSEVKPKEAMTDNPFERDNISTEIMLGPRVLLGTLHGSAKGPLEITVNQLKLKMEYNEKTMTILIFPDDLTSLKIHIDRHPKIIVLGVTPGLALKLRNKFSGNGKFLDPCSLVVGENDIILEVNDNLGPEMIVDLSEWAKDIHGKVFVELSLPEAQTLLERQNTPKSRYNTRSSSSGTSKSNISPTKMIIYPAPPLHGGITVTSADLECLAGGEFLNDVIIDFYLKYIYHDILSDKDQQRTHIFSSFFYKRLTQKMSNDTEGIHSSQDRMHNKVKKWTRNVDIFAKDFIIVPINESSHWYLAIICYPYLDGAVLENESSSESEEAEEDKHNPIVEVESTEEESPVEVVSSGTKPAASNKYPIMKSNPCILIFDSLGGAGRIRVTGNLRSYLSSEWKHKRSNEPAKEFSKDSIRGTFPKVPQQDNHCDCGVFVLQYVESFFKNPISDFRPPINKAGWFTQAKVASKRREIKDLIVCLSKETTAKAPDEPTSDR